jgi:hypothetical protein
VRSQIDNPRPGTRTPTWRQRSICSGLNCDQINMTSRGSDWGSWCSAGRSTSKRWSPRAVWTASLTIAPYNRISPKRSPVGRNLRSDQQLRPPEFTGPVATLVANESRWSGQTTTTPATSGGSWTSHHRPLSERCSARCSSTIGARGFARWFTPQRLRDACRLLAPVGSANVAPPRRCGRYCTAYDRP